jgi:hypothetical protein
VILELSIRLDQIPHAVLSHVHFPFVVMASLTPWRSVMTVISTMAMAVLPLAEMNVEMADETAMRYVMMAIWKQPQILVALAVTNMGDAWDLGVEMALSMTASNVITVTKTATPLQMPVEHHARSLPDLILWSMIVMERSVTLVPTTVTGPLLLEVAPPQTFQTLAEPTAPHSQACHSTMPLTEPHPS